MSSNPRPVSSGIPNFGETLRHVVIVDDHTFLAQSLARLLRDSGVDASVSSCRSAEVIVEEVERFSPALVLLDLVLGPKLGNGLDMLPDLIEAGAAVVILTGSTDRATLARCLEHGALGIIDKANPADDVIEKVHRALKGELLDVNRRHEMLSELRILREHQRSLWAPFELLTDKEGKVLDLLAGGLTAQEITEDLFVSMSTVRSHIQSILVKLGVHSQLAAVALAHERGWQH